MKKRTKKELRVWGITNAKRGNLRLAFPANWSGKREMEMYRCSGEALKLYRLVEVKEVKR